MLPTAYPPPRLREAERTAKERQGAPTEGETAKEHRERQGTPQKTLNSSGEFFPVAFLGVLGGPLPVLFSGTRC